ncbi:MAG: 3-dehydroquinate synthase [Alphaproteobacteria bacterium]
MKQTVLLGDASYDILIEAGLLQKAGALIKPHLKNNRVILITEETVAGFLLKALQHALDAAEIITEIIILPPEEEKLKSFSRFESLQNILLEMKIERNTTLLAFGGGVIGDLVGFTASTVLRGVPFIQIPTTLLAQVDSSVGGKTGINTKFGKNLVGTFYQPQAVLIDPTVLQTLPQRQILSGYAEIVKYGLIQDADFFAWLEDNGKKVIAGDLDALSTAIYKSCEAKAVIVAEDEKEAGVRALLNLGHTFAHAFELEAGYDGNLYHGEAVSIGIIAAARLSHDLGFLSAEAYTKIETHFKKLEMPADLSAYIKKDCDRLLAHMFQDKKVKEGKIHFILLKSIGEGFIESNIDMKHVETVLQKIK